jgi:hypothetical protein
MKSERETEASPTPEDVQEREHGKAALGSSSAPNAWARRLEGVFT